MEKGIEIHLAPSTLGHIGDIAITNTLLTAVTVSVLLIVAAFFIGRALKMKARGFQVVVELLHTFPYQFIKDTLGNEKLARTYFPIIMTIFLFILCVNWFGLLPFVGAVGIEAESHGAHAFLPLFYPGATDLNFTLALATIAFFTIEIAGILALGFIKYGGKFITFKSPLAFVIGIIELVSEIARLITFSFRLFGNIFAGKVLLLVVMFFVPLIVPVPILAFELFVGFIQAVVFAVLTLFFIKLAVESHGDDHEEDHSKGEASHSVAHT